MNRKFIRKFYWIVGKIGFDFRVVRSGKDSLYKDKVFDLFLEVQLKEGERGEEEETLSTLNEKVSAFKVWGGFPGREIRSGGWIKV